MKGGWRGYGRRLLAPTAQRAGGRPDSQARQVGLERAHPGPRAPALSEAGPAACTARWGRELARSFTGQLQGRWLGRLDRRGARRPGPASRPSPVQPAPALGVPAVCEVGHVLGAPGDPLETRGTNIC